MTHRLSTLSALLLLAMVVLAAPSSKYKLTVTLSDGSKVQYNLSKVPKLLWENDSIFITADTETLAVKRTMFREISFSDAEGNNNADVNSDTKTDTQDVLCIYEYMQSETSIYPTMALDINADGQVDTQDVLLVYEAMREAAAKSRAPAFAAAGIDQMVVVTASGDLQPYNLATSTSLSYNAATDSLVLNGVEHKEFQGEGIKQIYFEDKAIVDQDPYIVPQVDDYVNPNFMCPQKVAYEVMALDTAICRTQLKFVGEIPQMYVGQIYALYTDSIVLCAYLLTADRVNDREVIIRYRPAQIGELLYNTVVNITSNPDNPYFRDVEIHSRKGESKSEWKVDPVENLDVVKGMKDLYNIFKNAECDFGVDVGFEFGTDLQLETGVINPDNPRLREIAAKLKSVSVVFRGKNTYTNKMKFKFEFQKDWDKDIDVWKDVFVKDKVFMVGYVPVWATLTFDLCAMVKAMIDIKAMFADKVTEGFEVALGGRYDFESGLFTPISEFKHIYEFGEPEVDALPGSVAIRVWPYLRMNVYLYRAFGVHADLMPYVQYTLTAAMIHDKLFTHHKVELGVNWRAALFVEYPSFENGKLIGKRQDLLSYMSKDYENRVVWQYPEKIIDVDSLKALWAAFDTDCHLRFNAYAQRTLVEETGAGSQVREEPINKGTQAAVSQQSYSDFPWLLAENTPVDESYLEEMNQTIDVNGSMARMRLPREIRSRLPKFLLGNDEDQYNLVAQLPKPLKAPLRTPKHEAEIPGERGSGGLAEGLFKCGEPLATQCDDNAMADTHFAWPTPIGYTNVLRTSVLDAKGKPIMSIDREMPWEIKNFDATWTTTGGHGTIQYRDGGEHVTEVVWGADGTSVKFVYTRSSGSTTVTTQEFSATQPQRMLPGTSCMGSPDIPIAVDAEGMHFKGFVCAWDMMYWQAKNLERNPYAGKATLGVGEHLGYPCKTITPTGSGGCTVYFWQNLCLYATGEATFNVTSLNILDELDNPTVTILHDTDDDDDTPTFTVD